MEKIFKKKIVFNITSIKNWMGGVYYAQNIINLFLHSAKLKQQYEVHVLTPAALIPVFEKYGQEIKVVEMEPSNNYVNSIRFIWYMIKNKVDYWYVLSMSILDKILIKRAILWIADFQYIHLPQYFSKTELFFRNANVKYMAKKKNALVFSSRDAKNDFLNNYTKHRCECHVVHFASAIESEVRNITENKEKLVLQKYNLCGYKYIYIPNQFWQHKNHIVVFEMIVEFIKNASNNVKFVFTGQMHDYRNPEYTLKLQNYFEKDIFKEYVINLGFLDREEQLIIMKNAYFLIQPSLFEGWGTVLEDAKVLDKRVILSDLDVHKEQMYSKCVLFKRSDANELLELVYVFLSKDMEDDVEAGIQRFHEDSKEYAKELEKILL